MKKTLSILLAILLVLSTVPFASALVFTDGVINAGKDYKVTCGAKEELTYVTFTPETSGLYVFSSSDYDENGSVFESEDDGWYGDGGDINIGDGDPDGGDDWFGDDELGFGDWSLDIEDETVESDPYICIYDAEMNLIAENDQDVEPNDDGWFGALDNHFDCKVELEAYTEYTIGVGDKALDNGKFNFRVDKVFNFSHQPTADEPYVDLTSVDAALEYQWYIVTENIVAITNENASLIDQAQTPYDAENGWTPVLNDDGSYSFFRIELEAGDTVKVEFSEAVVSAKIKPNGVIIGPGLGDDSIDWGDIAGGSGEKTVTGITKTVADTFEYDLVANGAEATTKATATLISKVYTAVDGETEATLQNPVADNVYVCKVTLPDATVLTSDSFVAEEVITYAISHQPTSDEPYVAIDPEDAGATYQWYTAVDTTAKITDLNAEACNKYDAEKGWAPATDNFKGISTYFKIALNAGDKVVAVFDRAVTAAYFTSDNVIIGDDCTEYVKADDIEAGSEDDWKTGWNPPPSTTGGTEWSDINATIKKIIFTAPETAEYVLTSKHLKASAKATLDYGYVAVEGETEATLQNPVAGNEYLCKVTLSDNTVLVSDSFIAEEIITITSVIKHQPTANQPYVTLDPEDAGATYQWYTFGECIGEITDENADKVLDTQVYDETNGWTSAFDNSKTHYFFKVELKAGDVVECEFNKNVEKAYFVPVADVNLDGVEATTPPAPSGGNGGISIGGGSGDDSIGWDEISGRSTHTVSVSEDGTYYLAAECTGKTRSVKANFYSIVAVDGETDSTLQNPASRTKYLCRVTLSNGVVLTSNSFESACLHENAVDDGDCTTKVVCPDCKRTVLAATTGHSGGKVTCTEQAVCATCGKLYGTPLGHNTIGSVAHKDPTCTANGIVGGTYCSRCKLGFEEATVNIPKLEHNTNGVVAHKDATCTEEGIVGGTYCDMCNRGKSTAEASIPATGVHNTNGVVEHVDATCTTPGVVGGTYCDMCENTKAEAEAVIPATGVHNTNGVVTHKDATCTEPGVVGGNYCTVCNYGKEAAEAVIPAPGHNTNGVVAHKPATCTEPGVVGGTYCDVCNEGKAAAEAVIPVIDHTPGEAVQENIKEASCTVAGSYDSVVYCSVCDKELSRTPVNGATLPHNEDGYVAPKTATCTEEGVVGGTYCTACNEGKAAAEEVIPMADHNTNGVVAHKDASCTETGVVGGTYCTACGEGKEAAEAEIPLADHNQDGVVAHKDATCTETGVVGGTYCTACGEGKEAAEAEIPLADHNQDGVVAHKDATCTETGVVGGTYCTACGEGKEAAEEVIPLANHTEKIIKGTKATCAKTGLTDGVKCSVCDEILVAQEVIPLSTEHNMRTINHRDPTCKAVGIVGGDYCITCKMGHAEAIAQIPKLDHLNDILIPGTPATCQETGLTDGYKCSACNKVTIKQEEIPLADHNQDGVIKHKEPTCYTVGIVGGNFCTVCRYGREEALAKIPAKGHNSDGYIEHKDATCTEDGVVGGTYCTDCTDGLSAANQVIPAAHTPGEEVKENITPATCAKNETYELVTYCTVCGEEVSRQLVAGSKLPHTEEIIPAKPATCKETGLTEGVKCSVCGEILVAQEATPLAEHTYENGVCTECGHNQNSKCKCVCHYAEKNFIAKMVYAIFQLIWKLFGVHQICDCGAFHY